MTITIADGRGALWQWDTGRRVRVDDSSVKQVHYQNKCFGRSVDVDVGADGTAIIPDELLQDWHPLTAYVYVTDDTGAYTMVQQDFIVHKRAKPAGYVYTPTEQMTLQTIQRQIGDLADLTTEAKENLVAAINEAARTGGGAWSMELRVSGGYIQYSTDGGRTWTNLIAVAELKGDTGAAGAHGKDGHSPVVTATKSGRTTTISVDGAAIATVEDGAPGKDGADGKPGAAGVDGVTPHIGSNGNWYLGEIDTNKPSRGAKGANGDPGANGADGAPGKDGVTPNIQIGTVETLPHGSNATANITGTAADPLLNLGIPRGEPGAGSPTVSLGITGATPGQIAKITAVDASGAPTAWSPVDMPTGGGGDKPVVKIIDTEIAEKTLIFEANNLKGVSAIVAIWSGISNETETDSGLDLKINDVQISSFKFIPNRKKGNEVYGYSIATLVNEFWVCTVSAGAISGSNNSPASTNLSPYNLIPGVGAANKIVFSASTEGYAPVTGKLEVWAR